MSRHPGLLAVGRRLREERLSKSLSLPAFGAIGGASDQSQGAYEAGKTPPNVEFLLRLADHGVDIGYVLTGNRNSGELSFEQKLLFELFGKLSAREREAVMLLLMTLAGQTTSVTDLNTQANAGREQTSRLTRFVQPSDTGTHQSLDTLHERRSGFIHPAPKGE